MWAKDSRVYIGMYLGCWVRRRNAVISSVRRRIPGVWKVCRNENFEETLLTLPSLTGGCTRGSGGVLYIIHIRGHVYVRTYILYGYSCVFDGLRGEITDCIPSSLASTIYVYSHVYPNRDYIRAFRWFLVQFLSQQNSTARYARTSIRRWVLSCGRSSVANVGRKKFRRRAGAVILVVHIPALALSIHTHTHSVCRPLFFLFPSDTVGRWF